MAGAREDRRSPEAQSYRHLYKSARWQRLRQARLSEEPLCSMCAKAGRVTAATVCDHVKPHKGDPILFYDYANTQSLCDDPRWRCHSSGKQSEEKRGYSKEIGLDGWPTDERHPTRRAKRRRGEGKEMKAFRRVASDAVVFVREYLRYRFGRWECVRAHFRSFPRR